MKDKLKDIKLLILDVDGVLTNGDIIYFNSGEQAKIFNSKDGLGLKLLMDSGIKVGIITGQKSKALDDRCSNLGIDLVFDGIKDKRKALEKIVIQTGIPAEHTAFAGDDLIDLPIMKKVGIAFAVSDACEDVKRHSDIITSSRGGKGAVREICEIILKAQNLWEPFLNKYLS